MEVAQPQIKPAAEALVVKSVAITGASGPLVARLYRSATAKVPSDLLVVFFHPGGFVSGSVEDSDPCMREFASHIDAPLLSSGYAQAPGQPFPAAAEDAYAALADAAKHPKRYGWTGRTLVAGGVEAGGNLAAVAALMARDRHGPRLAGQLLITPMLDPGLSTDSMRCADDDVLREGIASRVATGYRDYLPRAGDRVHPYACPLASTRLKGLPPTMIVSIAGDPLVDEACAYTAKLAKACVHVESLTLQPTGASCGLVDADDRCRAAFDDAAYAAIGRFLGSLV
jgi:acetyl esterase